MLLAPVTVLEQQYQHLHDDYKDVIEGLLASPKTLPPKYFYDDRGSLLFEEICDLPEYYPTRTEASILRRSAEEIAQITNCCELIELGSGSSTKTQLLLNAYHKVRDLFSYIPVDVSGGILKDSVLQLKDKYPQIDIHGLLGTYEQALFHLESNYLQSRLLFFLGNSLGNFSQQECDRFLTQVSKTLKTGDFFLLGVDLHKDKGILEPAYNDAQGVTAAFNLNMLTHLNWRFNGNFDTNLFKHQAKYNLKERQIEMRLHCQESHWPTLASLDLQVFFEAGESILTEISRKFDLLQMSQQLESKGLKTVRTWKDDNGWFGLILCQKSL
ncbi:L-histidine N(alpha)-methyltransferase [Cylindrospermopsis raciborskii CS-506_D]|uniref:L-histidine N(Alpha)-methyltransferase n=1 Tax=Cylindrospermopsis raciborskii CS-506_A TaxID=2585140 RepID=A0A838WKR4_9CYAN|nr:L-histidine N(alpha)-methyltransferase [Cylindrospermopsis raciborskii]MBA4446041.1 L-histidine N(alpha)-methyltransferase [Cylindrospermopsis raciborskii CS-506_C]MBA4450271.1 L-histidine N(alpha)-methyltransferase [Cylindrospermopsis raciborskii CS-506_D]MBA4456895.1 L-histidine N(alpha)-methyltransferase [Cylindrospermopsis raciborskii CS-506_B]MBA4466251.1 L-histidine N(alpha)-methyltransferase [Cylindrospermopsis raciborskii CS-506_A]